MKRSLVSSKDVPAHWKLSSYTALQTLYKAFDDRLTGSARYHHRVPIVRGLQEALDIIPAL